MKERIKLKAVIFDLDGVIVDTEGLQWYGWVEVLKDFKIRLDKTKYISQYAGKTGTLVESELIKEHKLDIKEGSLLKQKEELLLKILKSKKINLMPYAREAIGFFLDKSIKTAVVSGSPKQEVILKLKKNDLLDKFSFFISRNDVEKGKPSPESYLLAIKRLKTNPENCIVFEDTQYGIESAKKTDLICFVIPNEFSNKQNFSRADRIFKDLKEAIEWIKENYNFE